ncbi:MAG: TonB-dependent receptor plug domain-containing protein [Elusimicrobiota bacterium]
MKKSKKLIFAVVLNLLLSTLFTSALSAQSEGYISQEKLLFQKVPIVVTAAKYEQKITEAPATIDVITAEKIENSGSRTIDEALRYLSGIDIRHAGTKLYLAPRGLIGTNPGGTNRVLCLIDGRPINTPRNGSFHPGLNVALTNVKKIEVIRGPGSALYGANAFAGVINIITKAPEDVNGLKVSVSGGEFSTQWHKLLFGMKKDKISALLTARYYDTQGPQLTADNSDYNDYNLYGKLNFSNLTLAFGHHQSDLGLPGSLTQPTPKFKEEIEESFVDISGNIAYTSNSNLMLRGYITNRKDKVQMVTDLTVDDKIRGIEMQNNWQINPKHLLIGGIDAKWESSKSEEALAGGEHSTRNIAIYLQEEFKPIEELIFTLGTRYDDHSVYGSVLSPRCSAVYSFSDTTIKTSYGEAFRAPTFAELYSDIWHDPSKHMVGNDNLEPEEIKTYEMDVIHIHI